MHATRVILQLLDDASNSCGCGDQNYVMPRVLIEKNPLPYICPAEAYFLRLVLGPYYGEGQIGLFHCGRDHRNSVGHAP